MFTKYSLILSVNGALRKKMHFFIYDIYFQSDDP